jgi:hypothetical protein
LVALLTLLLLIANISLYKLLIVPVVDVNVVIVPVVDVNVVIVPVVDVNVVIVPVVEVNDGSVADPDELINQDKAELVAFICPNVELLL